MAKCDRWTFKSVEGSLLIDNLVASSVVAVPEPTTLPFVLAAALYAGARRRRISCKL